MRSAKRRLAADARATLSSLLDTAALLFAAMDDAASAAAAATTTINNTGTAEPSTTLTSPVIAVADVRALQLEYATTEARLSAQLARLANGNADTAEATPASASLLADRDAARGDVAALNARLRTYAERLRALHGDLLLTAGAPL
jgi:hypothetical protein